MERVEERLRMEPRDVINILNWDLAVTLGREKNRYHKLFYSEVDQDWFVAICDERTKEVVTVLPYHYHNRWEISHDAMDEARYIAESGRKSELVSEPIIPVRADPNDASKSLPSVINISGSFSGFNGAVYKRHICRLSIEDYGEDKETILSNPVAIEAIRSAIRTVNPEGFSIHTLYMRFGRKGALKPFHLS